MDAIDITRLMQQAQASGEDLEHRIFAICELGSASGKLNEEPRRQIAHLMYELLRDSETQIQVHAACALGQLPSLATVQHLVDAYDAVQTKAYQAGLTHFESRIRDAVVSSLRQISGTDFGYDLARWKEWAKGAGSSALGQEGKRP
jgi:hypothetical protein